MAISWEKACSSAGSTANVCYSETIHLRATSTTGDIRDRPVYHRRVEDIKEKHHHGKRATERPATRTAARSATRPAAPAGPGHEPSARTTARTTAGAAATQTTRPGTRQRWSTGAEDW